MTTGAPVTPDPATLAAAFAAFSSVSRDLESSYRLLERETARLREELTGAEQRHAVEARQLEALLEALPGGVLLIDGEGRVQRANAAAIDLLGAPVTGERWEELRRRACDGGQGDLRLADGRRVSLAQKPLQPGPGRVLLLTDVTGTRKIEELLARHRRLAAMGEMAAALAHQVRTPLAAGLLYATNASRRDLSQGQRDALLDKSVACLHDLERLIGDMLRFARGATLAEDRLDLRHLLATVEASLRPVVAPGQSLTITPPARTVFVTGNREALASAIVNLATNALQAAGAGARVEIAARPAGLEAEITVSDDGPGVPEGLRERIFDPFFTSRPDGTGLGLPVARSIARAHRGDIVLASAGSRTTFTLRLPLAAADSQPQDRNAAA